MKAPKTIHGFYFLLVLATSMVACKKEAVFQPRSKDYELTIKDNPSDPVDHAIFQFYENTGIPLFYNDTISREQVSVLDGVPQYAYQTLAIRYSLTGAYAGLSWTLLPNKEMLLPMLPFLKDKLLPQLTNVYPYPLASIFIVSSSRLRSFGEITYARNNKPFPGFNSLMLINVNPAEMSDSTQREYIADALGIMAYKMLKPAYDKGLANEFDKVTRSTSLDPQIYLNMLKLLSPDGTRKLEDFSFLPIRFTSGLAVGWTPLRQADFLSYIEAVFFYNNNPTAHFETDFAAYPLIIKKYRMVQKMLKNVGFNIAD
ncbi:hypothetical protein HHL16_00025 [Pseudoflavitalea sp. G-6-1-2]|uniref:hypothetical protein n=1 Tax=Pseudoflavitalea sp. G-6-1-2 TaxID=2728841 RepID=UPI00146F6EE5|nr:hypothetical protein [Pseudoflavitalea sp. G-6-1-2]NML19230.1 hypothetical protein [Pseudoflavitalea sp. G-6-1-2]